MFDASYYEDLRLRTNAVLFSLVSHFRPDQFSTLEILIDHNEPGVAVEMICAALAEEHATVTTEQFESIGSLARDMSLDDEVQQQIRELVVIP